MDQVVIKKRDGFLNPRNPISRQERMESRVGNKSR